MRSVIQRVKKASVTVEHQITGKIEVGFLVFLGVEQGDSERDLAYVTKKVLGLRVFADANGKMNLSLKDIGGAVLVVSQFTLLGDVSQGNRPSFITAAAPAVANEMYEDFIARIRRAGVNVETGIFGADMQVTLTNDGPVTILIDSRS